MYVRCRQVLPGLRPLLEVMGEIAARRRKTLSQVAINWCMCQVRPLCHVGLRQFHTSTAATSTPLPALAELSGCDSAPSPLT